MNRKLGKINIWAFLLIVIIANSCKENTKTVDSNKEKLIGMINNLEDTLYGNPTAKIDKKKAVRLFDYYKDFASQYADDSLAPVFLYRAAEIAIPIGNPVGSVEIYNQIISQYPNFEKLANCYFMRAFVFDNNLRDYEKAKESYFLFLERFPKHELADDAQMSIQLLGKSDEEIIKQFEQNQTQQ